MARRTVYGKSFSENGWEMVDTGSCRWVRVPGTNVTLQIREGQPEKILAGFAADYNAVIEPLRDADSACWTATNSVSTSNHLSGTGMDLNWDGPPEAKRFRLGITKEQAYPGQKAKALDELLEWYEGIVFCGGYWSIRDWMHFQLGANTYGAKNVDKVNDFIRRKIRSDGFSTYKRSATAPTPPPAPPVLVNPGIATLALATGISEAKAREIFPGVATGLRESECDNPNRIAMWLAQMGHESASFVYTEEIASGAAYEGRKDLGNTQQGDGVRFKGRSWVQVTGRHNYSALSKWAFEQQAVPTPTFFVDEPAKLAQIQFAGLGPAWYWVVARPDINALSDKRDLVTVTKRINGGQNGIQDRRNRYDRALALGNRLMEIVSGTTNNTPPTTPGDDMSAEAERQIKVIYDELTKKFPSRSPLRHVGEGPVDTMAGFLLNTDGNQHVEIVTRLATYGDPDAIALLREVAGNTQPDRQHDAQLAQAILAEVSAPKAAPAPTYVPEPSAQFKFADDSVVARLSVDVPESTSTGALIGRAFDALEALKAAQGALSPEAQSSVDALITVLKTQGASE